MRTIVAAGLAAIVTACATVPHNAPTYRRAADPPSGQVNVYVYRIGAYPTMRTPAIAIDGKILFDPPEGSYTVVPLSAGQHEFTVDWAWDTGWPDLNLPVRIENEPVYIKISGSFERAPERGMGAFDAGSYIGKVKAPEAEAEMTQCCRYIAPRK